MQGPIPLRKAPRTQIMGVLGPKYCILTVFGISNPTIWVHGPFGTVLSSAGHGQPAALPGQDVWRVSWHPV